MTNVVDHQLPAALRPLVEELTGAGYWVVWYDALDRWVFWAKDPVAGYLPLALALQDFLNAGRP